jgi:hypothetical protein
VPNLASEPIELSSQADGTLLALLDGSRNRGQLAVQTGLTPGEVDESLRRFARLELLQ